MSECVSECVAENELEKNNDALEVRRPARVVERGASKRIKFAR